MNADLLTIKELKNNAMNNLIPDNLYDLNEKFNNEYIENILEDENIYFQDKIQSFNDIIYKLSYGDRINLLNKYKYIFDQDDMQKNFLL